MTPSSIRPTSSRTARRASLLAASALCGVSAMLVQPALAQTLPGIPSAANITVSAGGSQPVITAPGATELDIDLNASRTVINWASLHLSSADQMTFRFDAASDIVLNKTTSQIAIDAGATVSGLVGASTGGNIWFYSPQGVIVSPGANMSAGGFVFSRGSSLNDASFAAAADPLSNLRSATDALIRITTVSTATSASIDAAGNVLLSASSGALSVSTAEGATVGVSTTSGSITASEISATSGAALVSAGGPGATVTQITGATGVTVSSSNNTSVGAATTTMSGDILITSNGSASLTLGNSARDLTLSAPQVFLSTVDAGRDVFITGTTSAFVTNRIFAGDDIEITANGDVTAGGAYLKATGVGATDDAHILLRSTNGFVNAGNTLLTQGTGAQAGDITIQAATTATLGTADSTRDIKVTGVTASLANGSAARDVFVTATTGGAIVTTAATAGDDVEVTATSGAVSASGATLKSTGLGATDDGHVLARSTGSTVNVGSAITQGTGTQLGDITIQAASTATLGSGNSTRDLTISGASASLTTGQSGRDLFVTATTGNATVSTYAIAGDDLEVTTTSGNVLAGNANLWAGYSGGSDDGHVLVRSTNGSVNVLSAESRGGGVTAGDTTIQAGTTATVGGAFGSRNLTISAAGSFDLSGLYSANNTASFTSTAGAITESGGSVAAATLNLSGATGVTLDQINNIVSLGTVNGGTGGVTYRDVNNFALTGNVTTPGTVSLHSNLGAITQTGGVISAHTLNVTAETGIALNRANLVNNLGDVQNNTSGDVSFHDDDGFFLTGDVDSAGNVSLFADNGGITRNAGVLGATGDLSLDAAGTITLGDVLAGGDVNVTAAGSVFVDAVQAGDDILVRSTGGTAILRSAVINGTGAGHDITVSASGDAMLGADDVLSITSDNWLVRGSGAGVTTVRSISGDALVHLDNSSAIETVDGGGSAEVVVNTGPVSIGSITAGGGDLYVEALDGALTVGSATAANGDIELYNWGGGALTVTGTVSGGGAVDLGSAGLIDTSAAGLVSSGDDLAIYGGSVNLATLAAGDQMSVMATGDVRVQSAHAGRDVSSVSSGGDISIGVAEADTDGIVVQASGDILVGKAKANGAGGVIYLMSGGDATLRAGEATIGMLVYAIGSGKATFGADDAASITAANYGVTAVATGGCGCGPIPDGLQVLSDSGDAAINVQSLTNPIALAASGQSNDLTVTVKTGNLKIDELAGYNVTIAAQGGTLETGAAFSGGGDYTVTAHDFLGDALTPTLVTGAIRDVTITDTLGDLNLGTAAIHADRTLTIAATTGAVTGSAQLTAGAGANDGQVDVTAASGIAVDTIVSDRDVSLDGTTGLVNVATSVNVRRNYRLTGGGFSNAALAPQGLLSGTWTIRDRAGDFDFSGKTLYYGGSIDLGVTTGDVIGGDVYADVGSVRVEANGGSLGALYGGGGAVTAIANVGGMEVGSAQGRTRVEIAAANGAAKLGSALVVGLGGNQLIVRSSNGDVLLGAATPGAITAANTLTAAGPPMTVTASASAGKVVINLDRTSGADLTTIDGATGVAIKVANGTQQVTGVTSTGGAVTIDAQALLIDGTVKAASTVLVTSHGGLNLAGGRVEADGAGDAVVLASDGVFSNGTGANAVSTPNGRWLIYTQAAGDPSGSTAGNTFNGLSGKNFYGTAYDFTTKTFSGTVNAGNRFVYAYQPTLTVTPVGRVVTYDGAIPTISTTLSGVINGDLAADALTSVPVVLGATSKNAGTYALSVRLNGLTSDLNYAFASGTGTLRIDPKAISGVLSANDKTYDGATTATGAIALAGVVAGDTVTASGTYAFADRNAGAGKTVTASGAVLAGADAGNYTLTGVSAALANILRRSVAVAADPASKTFGQPDPMLTYHLTTGSLAAGDAFSGALARNPGEFHGDYLITRGTLALSANYDLTFTGAVFTIERPPMNEMGAGTSSLRYLTQSPDFSLDWDPQADLSTTGSDEPGGLQVTSRFGQAVASLR